ncbi:MAG TPA: DNA polymerase III subunit delta [Armatimonadota bacterium]|nr:DNA polymerase III subunit delta [Armatimonadota bacterium]
MQQKLTRLPKSGDLPLEGTWLLVSGDEEYLKRRLVERLRGQLLGEGDEFNLDQVDVAERWEGVDDGKGERLPGRAARILALAQALPFLGSGRLVIVRNADLLATDQQKALAAGLATVPPMNRVLLVTGEAAPGKKAAKLAADLQKAIEKRGTVYDCARMGEDELKEWVRELLHGWGQTIEPAALQTLIARAGTELRRVQVEVEKLSLMVGDGGTIRAADVELLTPQLAEESVFHLADAVAARNAAKALDILRDLLEGQLESPYRLFPMLVRQFRLIWQAKVMLDAGWRPTANPQQYPQAVALLPESNILGQLAGWMGNKLAQQARALSWTQLANAYDSLLACDMASKAIDGVPRQEMDLALEMLCAKLCATERAAGRRR